MRKCTFDGCDRPHEARGLCCGHDWQQRQGKPLTEIRHYNRKKPLPDFWDYVDDSGDCWLWTGKRDRHGYGMWRHHIIPHRYTYEIAYGPISNGMVVDHDHPLYGCHNPACVNPEHLQAVPPRTNIQRRRGAQTNSKSGERGVTWRADRKVWVGVVTYTADGKQKQLSFRSKDRAVVSAWVVEMRQKYHN